MKELTYNVKNQTVNQFKKGTEIKTFETTVTGVPSTWADFVKAAQENEALGAHFASYLVSQLEVVVKGRCNALMNAEQPVPAEMDFTEVVTTVLRKLTTASLCKKIETALVKLAGEMGEAIVAEDFEKAAKLAAKQKTLKGELAKWSEEREKQRLAKAAAREANASK